MSDSGSYSAFIDQLKQAGISWDKLSSDVESAEALCKQIYDLIPNAYKDDHRDEIGQQGRKVALQFTDEAKTVLQAVRAILEGRGDQVNGAANVASGSNQHATDTADAAAHGTRH